MPPFVRLRLPDGTETTLAPGDLLGRNPRAALVVDDASVSEAHALVSLRDAALRLLALRGGFVTALDEPPRAEVTLEAGLSIWLSRAYRLDVVEVALPDHLLALELPGGRRHVLSGVCSLVLGPDGGLGAVSRFRGGASAHLWSVGQQWQLRLGAAPARPVGAGDRFAVGGHPVAVVQETLAGAGHHATETRGAVRAPLRLVARYDTVHLHRPPGPVLVLTRTAARILSELVAVGQPVHWEALAREVWSDDVDAGALRGRWDVSLQRLRRRLAQAEVRGDLVSTDGAGNVELVLYPGDQIEDRT